MTGVLSRYPELGEDSTPRLHARPTLGNVLHPSRNFLNGLRLIFAGAVIVSHAWWLGGYGPEPSLYGIKLGTAAVMGFFAISGYLITLSADRARSIADYAAARLTRILPGLIVATLMVAFVAAPVGAMLTHGDYDFAQAVVFLFACLSPYMGLMPTPAIGTSLSGNPDPLDWDGPLWTLTWEALCYIVVALLVFSARRLPESRAAILATSFLFASVTGGIAVKLLQGGFGPGRADFALPLMAFFLAGSVLAHLRERVQTGALPFALALATAWLSLASSWAPILIPLPLTYIVLSLGSLRTLSRIGSRFDISYGVYIYGWPVQQLLAGMHLPALLPPLGYAAVALVAVWPLAFLSCVLVEQPAQRMRKSWTQRRSILV